MPSLSYTKIRPLGHKSLIVLMCLIGSKYINSGITAQGSAVSFDGNQIRDNFNREIGTARCIIDVCKSEVSFIFSLQRVDVMNHVRKACHRG